MNGYGIFYYKNYDKYEGQFKEGDFDGFGVFYSSLGFKYKTNFNNCLFKNIPINIYKIILILNYLYSIFIKNKITLFLILILIFDLLIN